VVSYAVEYPLFRDTPNWALAHAVQQEDTARIHEIVQSGKVDVNFKEPKFGQTLLILAIANGKLNSVAALLKSGADLSVRNLNDDQAIHEACKFPDLRKHSAQMIEVLISYGADGCTQSHYFISAT